MDEIKKCEHCGNPATVLVRMQFYGSGEPDWDRFSCATHVRVVADDMQTEATPIPGTKNLVTMPIENKIEARGLSPLAAG